MKRPKIRSISPEEFKELEAKWYRKLAEHKDADYPDGFIDIEDNSHSDRPLKDWHSRRFRSERARIRQEARERYNERIDAFLNRPDIDEICSLIVGHGNCVITKKKVKLVLELHRKGEPERKIAKKIRRSKFLVHRVIEKAREWMNVA